MRKLAEGFILFLTILLVGFGVYLVWINLPSERVGFEEYQADFSGQFASVSSQFYSNMRYRDKEISYGLSEQCDSEKIRNFEEAVERIASQTVLSFYQSENPQILITCSDVAPRPEEEGHFVAGEGGPTVIINASKYSVIEEGKISLFRADRCENPQIATHELLHALGFDHNSNPESIMYPITDCNQEIDSFIIEEINRIYAQEPFPDLVIEKASAEKRGSYLDFEINVANYGLTDSSSSFVEVVAGGEIIKSFELNQIRIGAKKTLTITNLRIPRKTENIILRVVSSESELNKENNEAELQIVGAG